MLRVALTLTFFYFRRIMEFFAENGVGGLIRGEEDGPEGFSSLRPFFDLFFKSSRMGRFCEVIRLRP